MAIFNRLRNQLNVEPHRTRLDQILSNNPDFETLSKYSKIIAGESIESNSDEKLNASLYRNASMVSCEIERAFSVLANIETDRRRQLTTDNIKNLMIVNWFYNSCCSE